MKKMNNKGFSLVELIIVIAIMAILAGAIAPALIRYIDKSRRSNDVSSCDTIETTINTALGTESIAEFFTAKDTLIKLVPAKKFATTYSGTYSKDGSAEAITITGGGLTVSNWESSAGKSAAYVEAAAIDEIGQSLNGSVPKIKFKKNAKTGVGVSDLCYYVLVTTSGAVEVYIAPDGKGLTDFGAGGSTATDTSAVIDGENGIFEIAPEVCESYQ